MHCVSCRRHDSARQVQGGPKNGYPALFGDNFGNSASILTILSLLQAEIYGAQTWSSSTHQTFIVRLHCLAKQTLVLISVQIREREHFSRNVVVSVGVSHMRKTRVVFTDSGAKVNSSYYCNIVLEKGLLPDIRAICRHYRWTLQQDGAPAHTARTTMDYLKREHINFIKPHMWPPNSPDINPVDYAIWGALQQRVYHQRQFKTVEELKRAIVT